MRADPVTLQAYHDGELSALRRWRLRRRLARDPAARRELDGLAALGSVVRETLADASSVDLWEDLAGRLRSVDAEIEAEAPRSGLGLRILRPAAAGAVLAAVVAGLVFFLTPAEPSAAGVVRWLDTNGRAVLVLDASEGATIIWLMESGGDQAGGGRRLLGLI